MSTLDKIKNDLREYVCPDSNDNISPSLKYLRLRELQNFIEAQLLTLRDQIMKESEHGSNCKH